MISAPALARPLFRSSTLRLVGPAFAVSIGYVDPGNWISDLAAGSYRFSLLWAIVLANALAIVLQIAVTRVTVTTGSDFATLVARRWPALRPLFGVTFVGAAMATDLAEFTGIVLGAQLLFGLSTVQSLAVGLAIVALLLSLTTQRRMLDVVTIGSMAALGWVFAYLAFSLHPDTGEMLRGTMPTLPDSRALLVVVAIIGATVMPHNLFLHSALVKKRCDECPDRERAAAARFFTRETLVALNIAAAINVAILVVGACLPGHNDSLQAAFGALTPATSNAGAALFGVALLVSGIAASVTATMSGDYIFAAFSPVRMPRSVRRGITIVPTALALACGFDATALLLWSQVALCFALPVALMPLVAMIHGTHRAPRGRRFFALCATATAICVALDVALLVQTIHT